MFEVPARIIATVTNDDLGLDVECEIIGASDLLKKALLTAGMAIGYDDTKPLPPKGLNEYEPGMVYSRGRQIIYNDSLYISDVAVDQKTSATWINSEWRLIITGTSQV